MLSQVANAATDTLKESLTSYQLPVRYLNGNVIGTQNTTLRLELSKEKNVETVTMFDETTYSFFKDEDVYKKVYKNGSRVTKLEKQANGEFFINGSKVNLTINETKVSGASPRAVDSGGKEWLTYYTNFSDNPYLYECLGYPSANNFLDYGLEPN
ncbi:hypothetical protein [Paenibacillus chitinolyticus]|uniref:hypothetical protein n=1 Tax=Paenibacillus chitinolyticus TaxID=79263 RepID=UPI00366ACFF6